MNTLVTHTEDQNSQESPDSQAKDEFYAKNKGNLFSHNLIAQGKLKYIQGDRPAVDCILCAVFERTPGVYAGVVWEDENLGIIMNPYPYNPGHVMAVPKVHYERFYALPVELITSLFTVVQKVQQAQEIAFHCVGHNVGINDGEFSGQSIKHVHVHVVPRFQSELGYIDIIGKTRVIPLQLDQAFEILKETFASLE